MNKQIDVIKLAREQFPDAIMIDGFDEAIIGFSIRLPKNTNFVYSVSKIINKLINRDGMTYFEAEDFYTFNIKGASFRPQIEPIYIDDRIHFSNN